MKKIIILLIATGLALPAMSQKIDRSTVRRFSLGTDLFTDILMNKPEGMDIRTINQGAGIFGMYNFPIGESDFSFAIGAGITCHNIYSDSRIEDFRADTIVFVRIPDSIDYSRSKLGLTYLDFPMEFRLKTEQKFRMSVGFKVGVLIDAKTKFKGENEAGDKYIIKEKQVAQLEKWRYGPTIRIGYDWINVVGFFSLSQFFQENLGPEYYPVSVGITLMPF